MLFAFMIFNKLKLLHVHLETQEGQNSLQLGSGIR